MPPIPAFAPDAPAGVAAPTATESGARFRDRVRQRSGHQEVLVVRIGDERFGIPLEAVDELVESPRVRAVPGSPAALLGVFTLGEAMLPLYAPAALLGATGEAPQVALVMRGGRRRVALAVDDADDVVRVDLSQVRDAPRVERHDDIVLGVFWRDRELVAIVDARALVAACGAAPQEEPE